MDSKLLFPAAIFLVLCLIDTGSSLKCHQCNSYDSYHCDDPFYYADDPQKKPKTMEFLDECEDPDAKFCRKIKQTVRDDTRVIRTCGKEEDIDPETQKPRNPPRDCYTTVHEEYNTEVCSCIDDGCNSASMFTASAAVFSAVALAYLLH